MIAVPYSSSNTDFWIQNFQNSPRQKTSKIQEAQTSLKTNITLNNFNRA